MQEQSSTSTGPTCDDTTMCGHSRQHTHTHTHRISASTSSAAASPAKTSALQAREPDSQERGQVFGTSSLGSLASYDPATSSWRTSQRSLLGGWEPFSVTFPRSGMTRSGTLFQLQPLVRRTGGNECGSSAFVAGLVHKPTHHVPTPTASDHISRKSTSSETLNYETNKTVSLDRFVTMYPTPTTKANQMCPSMMSRGVACRNLRSAMWPTPRTTDVQAGRGCVQIGNGLYRPSKALSAGRLVGGANLADAVQMLPTPTAQDASNNGGPSQYERNSLPLNAVAGGSLNPTWVEWLMGFPLGWTALDASETPSSRKSSKSSGGRFLKRKRG
jgi:hypothetical protein